MDEDAPFAAQQDIRSENGIAYGVIGADLHVWGDGVPLYLLENWHDAPRPDPDWLRELPSRLLNARYEVVDFTGREAELGLLHEWRRGDARLGIRLLYGPGGAGKTRLAARFASESAADNWKVVTATLGPGTLLPALESQDLRPGETDGVLLIIDYADHWPVSYLALLLSSKIFHRHADRKTRILMVARNRDSWPGLQHKLQSQQPSFSSQLIDQLPEGPVARGTMFAAAARSFAAHYGRPDLAGIKPAAGLEGADFGLVLAVHMAALVAVDARASSRRAPPGEHADVASLTMYLLNREHDRWAQLHRDGTHELAEGERTFRTPPGMLNRAVFCAALTGTVERATGIATLQYLPGIPEQDAERIVDDHATCYPAAGRGQAEVFTPLYPDRLAEDFLALTIPGHDADYPDQEWAHGYAYALLGRLYDQAPRPGSAASARLTASGQRALLFLASAAQRWPHVWRGCLHPILTLSPGFAVAGGSSVLSALARIGADPEAGIEQDVIGVLRKIEARLPSGTDYDLDIGMANLTGRLVAYYAVTGGDPDLNARVLNVFATRCRNVGRDAEALAAGERAVSLYRDLAAADPAYLGRLADALGSLAGALRDTGRLTEALSSSEEAVTIVRRLGAAGENLPLLAAGLHNLSIALAGVGRTAEATNCAEESVAIRRTLAADAVGLAAAPVSQTPLAPGPASGTDPSAESDTTAQYVTALSTLSVRYEQMGRHDEAIAIAREALAAARDLAEAYPGGHLPDVARMVGNLGAALDGARPAGGLAYAQECAALFRRLAKANPGAYERQLAVVLSNVGIGAQDAGRLADAVESLQEAVALNRRLVADGNDGCVPELARSLGNLGSALADTGDLTQAIGLGKESVDTYRRLTGGLPAVYLPGLAETLNFLGNRLTRAGQLDEALPYAMEAAATYWAVLNASPDDRGLRINYVVSASNLCATISLGGAPKRALAIAKEAVAASAPLADGERDSRGLRARAYALHNLTTTYLRLGRFQDAVSSAQDATATFERLPEHGPESDAPGLRAARQNLAEALDHASRRVKRRLWPRRMLR